MVWLISCIDACSTSIMRICQAGDLIVLSAGLVELISNVERYDDFNFSLAVLVAYFSWPSWRREDLPPSNLPQILLVASIGLAVPIKKENI